MLSSPASSKSEDEIRRENQKLMESLEPGDLVKFLRRSTLGIYYYHWAVYIGNGKIIHFGGDDERGTEGATQSGVSVLLCGKKNASVKEDDFMKVAGKSQALKNNELDNTYTASPGNEVVARAIKSLGPRDYDIISSNCEHFANWCRYEKEVSKQVEEFNQNVATIGERVERYTAAASYLRRAESERRSQFSGEAEN